MGAILSFRLDTMGYYQEAFGAWGRGVIMKGSGFRGIFAQRKHSERQG